MVNTKNIFLIGMMGSGKSSVGRVLSKKLNMPLSDIDYDIESLTELTIYEIFDNYGEDRFRKMESLYFKEKSKQDGIIFSTGGGIVLEKMSRKILINNGVCIFLDASVSVLSNRIKKLSSRPLLKGLNKDDTLNKIYNKRIDYYRECSDLIINTENLSPNLIAEAIIIKYNEKN